MIRFGETMIIFTDKNKLFTSLLSHSNGFYNALPKAYTPIFVGYGFDKSNVKLPSPFKFLLHMQLSFEARGKVDDIGGNAPIKLLRCHSFYDIQQWSLQRFYQYAPAKRPN